MPGHVRRTERLDTPPGLEPNPKDLKLQEMDLDLDKKVVDSLYSELARKIHLPIFMSGRNVQPVRNAKHIQCTLDFECFKGLG